MRIVLDARLARWREPTGTGIYTRGLLRGLCELDHGHEFVLLDTTSRHSARPHSNNMPATMSWYRLPLFDDRLWKAAWMLATFPPLDWFVGGFDLLHCPNIDYVPASRAARVVTVHDLSFITNPEWHRRRDSEYHAIALRRSVAAADIVIANSHHTAMMVRDVLDVPDDRLAVTHLGVGPPQTPSAGWVGPSGPYMVFVGTIEPRKNLLRLLAAFRTARLECRLSHRLIIIGKRGWKDDDIVAAVDACTREGWCTWVGYASPGDMAATLAGADALLYPSLDEGFGLPPLEAMSAGVPVLATTAGAVPEVVGEAALLVDPLDTDQIAAGISNLAQDAVLRARLAALGLERARKFTWAATASGTLSAYERAAQA